MELMRACDDSGSGIAFYGESIALDKRLGLEAFLTRKQRIAVIDQADSSLYDYDTFEDFAEDFNDVPRFVKSVAKHFGTPLKPGRGGQLSCDTQSGSVAPAAPVSPESDWLQDDHVGSLSDPLLALAADVLDDLERVRIANENRLRQLTRSREDKDGA